MSRILVGLASLNSLLLLFTFTVGFLCEGRAHVSTAQPLSVAQQTFTWHLISGLSTAILTLLVHSLIFTYFIGTGRWVQEVVKAYCLQASMLETARTLKLRALPFLVGSILLVTATATLGAATDRGMLDPNIHLTLATVAIAFNFWSYVVEFRLVARNGALITEIMDEVTRIRRDLGVESFAAGD